jgi:Ni2+-binding GTPase involved in maturation of urease and hydrogenase
LTQIIKRTLEGWRLDALDFLFIENVGNLVCPSSYDLGESFVSFSSPPPKAKISL